MYRISQCKFSKFNLCIAYIYIYSAIASYDNIKDALHGKQIVLFDGVSRIAVTSYNSSINLAEPASRNAIQRGYPDTICRYICRYKVVCISADSLQKPAQKCPESSVNLSSRSRLQHSRILYIHIAKRQHKTGQWIAHKLKIRCINISAKPVFRSVSSAKLACFMH